jgi:hypothetical protein
MTEGFYLVSIFVIFAALIAETVISHAAMRRLEKRIERIERQMKY